MHFLLFFYLFHSISALSDLDITILPSSKSHKSSEKSETSKSSHENPLYKPDNLDKSESLRQETTQISPLFGQYPPTMNLGSRKIETEGRNVGNIDKVWNLGGQNTKNGKKNREKLQSLVGQGPVEGKGQKAGHISSLRRSEGNSDVYQRPPQDVLQAQNSDVPPISLTNSGFPRNLFENLAQNIQSYFNLNQNTDSNQPQVPMSQNQGALQSSGPMSAGPAPSQYGSGNMGQSQMGVMENMVQSQIAPSEFLTSMSNLFGASSSSQSGYANSMFGGQPMEQQALQGQLQGAQEPQNQGQNFGQAQTMAQMGLNGQQGQNFGQKGQEMSQNQASMGYGMSGMGHEQGVGLQQGPSGQEGQEMGSYPSMHGSYGPQQPQMPQMPTEITAMGGQQNQENLLETPQNYGYPITPQEMAQTGQQMGQNMGQMGGFKGGQTMPQNQGTNANMNQEPMVLSPYPSGQTSQQASQMAQNSQNIQNFMPQTPNSMMTQNSWSQAPVSTQLASFPSGNSILGSPNIIKIVGNTGCLACQLRRLCQPQSCCCQCAQACQQTCSCQGPQILPVRWVPAVQNVQPSASAPSPSSNDDFWNQYAASLNQQPASSSNLDQNILLSATPSSNSINDPYLEPYSTNYRRFSSHSGKKPQTLEYISPVTGRKLVFEVAKKAKN